MYKSFKLIDYIIVIDYQNNKFLSNTVFFNIKIEGKKNATIKIVAFLTD